ncbi:MAG: SRPBCC family protein [bacterium]
MQKSKLSRLSLLAVLVTTSVAVAKPSFHERLAAGEIIVETKAVKNSDIPQAIVTAVIDAPPANVWAIISDCNHYEKNMIRVAEAKELSRKGDEVVCEVTTDMPFPLSNLTAQTRAKHTVGPPVWSREWKLIKGDYKSNEGGWRIQSFDLEGTKSLVVYTVHAVPDMMVPDSLIKKAQRDTLPDLMKNLRKKVKK